jgi:TolA-binding protein
VSFRRFIYGSIVGVAGIAPLLWAQGTTTPADKAKAPPGAPSDIEKVERVLAARRDYQVALEQLRMHYIQVGDIERARWAEDELRQFHRMNKQAFRLELDVPPPTLQASQNIPEANELYKRGMAYKGKGWGSDYLDNQRRAELLFQQILTNYPQSDKIDDAAYQLGDIYESSAYKHYRRAAHYFERCFQWNPNTQFDARSRAARLYD